MNDPQHVEATPFEGIAVIGYSGRFPGAPDADTLWANLRAGVESISFFSREELLAAGVDPALLAQPNYVPAAATLADVEAFDAAFFGYSPREAEVMDPQQRVFLETAYAAIEHAGYEPRGYPGRIGVYAGAGMNTYLLNNVMTRPDLLDQIGTYQALIGSDKDFLATRVSYKLNLRGPSVTIQTACSTSLVAVTMACQSLMNAECDMALAGGVTIRVPQTAGYLYQEEGILSPDGHCRPFDAAARGTVPGSGAGAVVLKRLPDAIADGDAIHAVIRGWAINNDGAQKVGFTAPSVEGQSEAIVEALALAEVEPATIGYIETHGTGTHLGDPIEIRALANAFAASGTASDSCALGSLKSNFGHLDGAAGVTGLIKSILAVQRGEIPPTLHFETLNREIDLESTPFYVNAELREWRANGPRRAGVSSFGIGGTNAHVVIEEAPRVARSAAAPSHALLVFSGRSEEALDRVASRFAEYAEQNPGVSAHDAAFTLQTGRAAHAHRRFAVCSEVGEAVRKIASARSAHAPEAAPGVVFLFPGQGAQYANMAAELYRTYPIFREEVDRCAAIMKSLRLTMSRDGGEEPTCHSEPAEPRRGEARRRIPHLQSGSRASAGDPSPSSAPHAHTPTPGAPAAQDDRTEFDLRSILFPAAGEEEAARRRLEQTSITQPAIFTIEYALARLWMSLGVQPEAMLGHSVGEYVAACLSGVFSLEDALRLVTRRGALIQQLEAGAMIAVPLPEAEIVPLLTANSAIAGVNAPALCTVSGPAGEIDALEERLRARGVESRRLHTSHAFHSPMMDAVLEPFRHEVESVILRTPRIPFVSNVTGTWITAEEAMSAGYWTTHVRQAVRFSDGAATLLAEGDRLLVEVGPGQTLASFVRQQPAARGRTVLTSMRHPLDEASDVATFLDAVGGAWLAGATIDWSTLHRSYEPRRVPLPTYPFERVRHWIEPDRNRTKRRAIYKRSDVAEWLYVPSWKRTAPVEIESDRSRFLLIADEGDAATRLARGAADVIAPGATLPEEIAEDVVFVAGERSVADVLQTAQALAKRARGAKLRFIIVTNALCDVTGSEPIDAGRAAILGLCKVIAQEYPNLTCRVVDFDGAIDAELCVGELHAKTTAPVVAYRGGHRWVEAFEPFPLADGALDAGAHVLITGGLGRFGTAAAEHLVRERQAKVTLVDVKTPPDDVRRALEDGGSIAIAIADVADRDAMRAAIAEATRRFGKIDAVIHAAGTSDGVYQTIAEATASDLERHMKPKLEGLRVLDELLRETPPRIAVVASSLASILGGITLGPYAAADAAVDAFAERSRARGGVPWTSANFEGWETLENDGDAALVGKQQSELMLDRADMLQALDRVMSARGVRRVIVSTGDLDARVEQWTQVREPAAPAAAAARSTATTYRAPETDTEIKVAAIWHDALGVSPIGLDDDFFELGGNSLIGLQILSRLRGEFEVELPLRSFFEARTVEGMARAIEGEMSVDAGELERLEAILGEIESLSDEEIERLTQEEASDA